MDYLDEQDFYEVCQRYRHAKDWKTENGLGTVSEAFEALKDYIRQQHTKALPDALEANALLIAENRQLKNGVLSLYGQLTNLQEWSAECRTKQYKIGPDALFSKLNALVFNAKALAKHGGQS